MQAFSEETACSSLCDLCLESRLLCWPDGVVAVCIYMLVLPGLLDVRSLLESIRNGGCCEEPLASGLSRVPQTVHGTGDVPLKTEGERLFNSMEAACTCKSSRCNDLLCRLCGYSSQIDPHLSCVLVGVYACQYCRRLHKKRV